MIGERIREARLNRGGTQEQLAELIESSARQVSRYETNEGFPSVQAIIKIAQALNVSTDYLLGLSDTMDPYRGIGLNEVERAIISALRHGNKIEAMKVLVNEG